MKQIQLVFLVLLAWIKRARRGSLLKSRPLKPVFLVVVLALSFLLIKVIFAHYSRQVLIEGMVGVYTTDNLPPSVTNLISQPLVSLDSSGNPQPKLAKSIEANEDSTAYTVKLKDNLSWADGSAVKAADIKFNLTDVVVSYPDDKTIQFKLAEPFSPFPTLITHPIFKDQGLVGISGYKVSSVDLSQGIISRIWLSAPDKALPDIVVRFYADEHTLNTAFSLGEVDVLIGPADPGPYKGQLGLTTKKVGGANRLVAIFYNLKDPLFSDKNLRLALSYASPKIEDETVAKTSLSQNSWAFNNNVRDFLDNTDQAKSYLAKAHYDKDTPITLTTTPALESVAQKVIESWQRLGVPVVVRTESGVPQNFQALLISQTIPQDPDQYSLWHSTQAKTNLSKYSSPRVDKDLEDARKTSDQNLRKDRYADFQRVLLDDAPATFLYFSQLNVIYRNKVEGLLNKVLLLQTNFST